jgi:hypothetical protein
MMAVRGWWAPMIAAAIAVIAPVAVAWVLSRIGHGATRRPPRSRAGTSCWPCRGTGTVARRSDTATVRRLHISEAQVRAARTSAVVDLAEFRPDRSAAA